MGSLGRGSEGALHLHSLPLFSNPVLNSTNINRPCVEAGLFCAGNDGRNRKRLVATADRYERVYKRIGERSVTFCGEEAQRNEREMTFCENKKVVASDMQLATTWCGWRDLILGHM